MSGFPSWLFPVAGVGIVALVAVMRRLAPVSGLPLGDASALAPFARRTLAVKGAIAVIAALLVALAATLLREPDDPVAGLVPGGTTTMVVLDVSASVSDLVYHEIAETLTLLAAVPDRSAQAGLVLFSDTAYEAIPPGAPLSELAAYVRFFRPRSAADERIIQHAGVGTLGGGRQFGPTVSQGSQNFIMSPWFRKFSGGTRISTGLVAAREALDAAGSSGRVLLLSDLADTFTDQNLLAQELATYAQRGLPVDVVALPPATPETVKLFRNVLGEGTTIVRSAALRASGGSAGARGPGLPIAFMALAGLVAVGLAGHELRFTPLSWQART